MLGHSPLQYVPSRGRYLLVEGPLQPLFVLIGLAASFRNG